MSQLSEEMKQSSAADPSSCSFRNLQKLGKAFIQGNEVGNQEFICLLLRQSFVYTSRNVVFIKLKGES